VWRKNEKHTCNTIVGNYFWSTLACILSFSTFGSFRPRVYLKFVQQNLKTLTYQSLAKVEEGLTQDAKRITETIRSCDRDDGLNI
jgi:hypothetical protein